MHTIHTGKDTVKNMKNKKRALAALAAVMLLSTLILAGCGGSSDDTATADDDSLTAAEVLTAAAEVMSSAESITSDLTMQMSMTYIVDGEETDISVAIEQQIGEIKDTAAHIQGTITSDGVTVESDSYVFSDGDSYIVYTYSDGEWASEVTDYSFASAGITETLGSLIDSADALTMTDSEYDGTACYAVSGIVSAELMSMIADTAEALFSDANVDLSSAAPAVTVYIDADELTLCAILFDLTDSFDELVQDSADILGFDLIEVTAFTYTMDSYSFNTVDSIELPDDAVSNDVTEEETEGAEDAGSGEEDEDDDADADASGEDEEILEDSGYTLSTGSGSVSVSIDTPDGYVYSDLSDDTYLQFNREDAGTAHEITLAYVLYEVSDSYSAENLANSQSSVYKYMLTSSKYTDVSFEEVTTIDIDGLTVYYTVLSYTRDSTCTAEYNTWIQNDDGTLLQCTVEEVAEGEECDLDLEETLRTAYASVKF